MSKTKNQQPKTDAEAAEQKMESRVMPIREFKMLESKTGGFAGIGSPFLEVDSYGDIVMPGAYADTIKSFLDGGFNADSHGWSYGQAIGYPTLAEEREEGLYFESTFHGTEDAQNVRQKMRERDAAGKKVFYSIGYYVKEAEIIRYDDIDENLAEVLTAAELEAAKSAAARWGRVRLLKAIDLAEISAVLRPAARGAEGTSVKSVEAEEGGATANEAIGVEGKSNENNDEGDRRDDPRLQTRQADALAALDDVIERWKDIDDLCLKEGRSISESRRKRLRSLRDDLAGGVKELDALLAETEPKPKDEGKTDDLWDLRAQAEMISVRHGTR